jgi:CSLREA domain-containing protein
MPPFVAASSALLLVTALASLPATAATIVVNVSSDTAHACAATGTGTCSLRDAILFANATAGADTINFNIPGAGVQTIAPITELPSISEQVTIDGYTQPLATANTLATGNNANLLIQLDGSGAGAANGLVVLNAPNTLIRGLVINRFALVGIRVAPTAFTAAVTIQGNFIGTAADGTAALGNSGSGIEVANDFALSFQVGGNSPGMRNLISGNTLHGILLGAQTGQVQGNYIGTNAAGTAAIANGGSGVNITGHNNLVGGNPAFGQRNVISGNAAHGIAIASSASMNSVQGNFIGTNGGGTLALPNAQDGIRIDGPSTTLGPMDNVIGGNLGNGVTVTGSGDNASITSIIGTDLGKTINLGNGSGPGNAGVSISGNAIVSLPNPTIAFNSGAGIAVSSNPAVAVIVVNGSFFSNGGRAIDLTGGPPPANDTCDVDTGNNDLMNYPVLNSATITGSTVQVDVTFNGVPGFTHTIEFFSSNTCDPSGFGEGKTPIGTTSAVPGPAPGCSTNFLSGHLNFPAGQNVITAYARGAGGKTSEFSQCVVATGTAPPVVTGVSARRIHGAAGTFDMPVPLTPMQPATEPRIGPDHTIVFTFDKPVTAGNASTTEGTVTVAAPTFSGNEMRVALSNVANIQYVTLNVSNVAASDGSTGGSGSARIGFLQGDVNQSRVVSVADLGLVNAVLTQPVTVANYLRDVNANGTLTVSDKGLTNAVLTTALPAP